MRSAGAGGPGVPDVQRRMACCIGPFTPDGNMTFVDCPEQIIMIEGDKCRVVMVPKAEGKP